MDAGLADLLMKTIPSEKSKEEVLGFFSILERLVEEDEEMIEPEGPAGSFSGICFNPAAVTSTPDNEYASESRYRNANDELSDTAAEPATASETDPDGGQVHENTSKLHGITTKWIL